MLLICLGNITFFQKTSVVFQVVRHIGDLFHNAENNTLKNSTLLVTFIWHSYRKYKCAFCIYVSLNICNSLNIDSLRYPVRTRYLQVESNPVNGLYWDYIIPNTFTSVRHSGDDEPLITGIVTTESKDEHA